MTLAAKQRREMERAIRASYRKHRNIRRAASAIGLPFQTFYDRARALDIDTSHRPARRRS